MLSLLLGCALIAAHEVVCLKLRDLVVPAVVNHGDGVWLNCTYDLEREKLYSIKWHKNNVEFYRFLPEDKPPGQKYELAGIVLDLSNSSEGNVYMSTTSVDSEGVYRCEVSTEAPSFRTVKGEKEMRIYVNPSVKPIVSGTKQHYGIGELVNATCASAASRPAALLKWWINGQEARPDQVRRPTTDQSPDGLFTSVLLLRFEAEARHFEDGRMKLQCEAIVSQAHTLRSEEILVSRNTTASSTADIADFDPLKDGPTIRGGRNKYQVGDVVDINCTAAKSQPPAELHWYINDKEVRPAHLVPYPAVVFPDGESSTALGLRFTVRPRHFQRDGTMRLRCTAALSEVRRVASEPLEAEIAQQQISDLHVHLNVDDVRNAAMGTWRQREELWSALFVMILLRTYLQ